MKPNKLLSKFLIGLALVGASTTVRAQWLFTDVGAAGQQGILVTNGDSTLTMTAGGHDIWDNADDFSYYYQSVSGTSWAALVRVASLDGTSSTWAKNELMLRETLDRNSRFLAQMTTPAAGQNEVTMQWRAVAAGGSPDQYPGNGYTPTYPNTWMMVIRNGSVFTFYRGTDGSNWTQYQSIDTAGTGQAGTDNGTTWGNPLPDPVLIGVAVTSHNSSAMTTSTFSQPVLTSLVPPTAVGIQTDVTSMSTHVGSEAHFHMTATNNASPLQTATTYTWYKGTALSGTVVPGVTGQNLTWLAQASDNGATYQAVATLAAPYNNLSVTSAVATLTVANDGSFVTNALKLAISANVGSHTDVESGNVTTGDQGNGGIAGKLRWLSAFETGGGFGDNTGRRVSGWFVPWVDGNYNFYVASDDDATVYVSTDSTVANKQLVCQENGWSGFNNWTTNADATTNNWNQYDSAQKGSATWTNGDGLGTTPWSAGFGPLTHGQLYYIEVNSHNGTGGDNLSVTAQTSDTPPPANGSETTLRAESNNIVLITYPVLPTLTLAFQAGLTPTNVSVYEGSDAIWFAGASGNSEFAPHYQWQKFSTNVPGATGSQFSMASVQAAQNGTPVRVIASVPGLSITSSPAATLTVQSAVFEPGFVQNQRWNGPVNWGNARDGTLGTPTYQSVLPGYEAAIDNPSSGNMVNYTRKMSGVFIAPATDKYVFFVNSDDGSGLFIATDGNPANKVQIGYESSWSNPFQWNSGSNGDWAGFKRSDMYWDNGTAPFQHGGGAANAYGTNGIQLTLGQKVYLEDDSQQGGGGGNMEVTMKRFTGADPSNGSRSTLIGTNVGINAPRSLWVRFLVQPTNPPPVAAGSSATANFYAFGDTDSQLRVGSSTSVTINGVADELQGQYVFFQWYKNGTAIAGQTGSQLSLVGLRYPSDNGAQFYCTMRSLGYGVAPATHFFSNSLTATLTVNNNPTVPTIVNTSYLVADSRNEPNGHTYIAVTFNVAIDSLQATNPASYTVPGATVLAATTDNPTGTRVILTLDVNPGFPVTVTFTGLRSWSNVPLSPSTATVSQTIPGNLTFLDIGTGGFGNDPVFPSRIWVEGANAFTIAAQGSDIWNAADGFNFLFEQKTGNFDVVMRQTAYGLSSPWAKCGLMAREGVDTGSGFIIDDFFDAGTFSGTSRNWNVVNDPAAVPVNGGTGANAIEANNRPHFTNVFSLTNSTGGGTGMETNSSTWWPAFNNAFGTGPLYPNAWLRLKRVNQTLTAYAGYDGNIWWQVAQQTITDNTNNATPMPATMFVGICVTGHGNDSVNALPQNQVQWNYASVDHYNSAYAGGTVNPPKPTVSIGPLLTNAANPNGYNVISWTPAIGRLQWSTDGMQTWSDRGYQSPFTNGHNTTVPVRRFFRVAVPVNP